MNKKKKKFVKESKKPSHKWFKIPEETLDYFKKMDEVYISNTPPAVII